jgi:Holliday junction resolvase RusA-like endonuclease|tara:strand:- start:6 stop:437 length:432 start_codon:yes stop_codon:yes gene_type:complete
MEKENGYEIDFFIDGEPASAKNQRRIVRIGNQPRLIKSKKALDYCKKFDAQVPSDVKPIEGDVALRLDVWYASRRPDLAAQELIMDLLQGFAYENDRQVKAVMSIWNLDRENPRTRIRVRRMQLESSSGLSSYKHSEIWGEDQ